VWRKSLKNGHGESSGFSRARLRCGKQIMPGEYDRNRFLLDGRWLRVARIGERTCKLSRQAKLCKKL